MALCLWRVWAHARVSGIDYAPPSHPQGKRNHSVRATAKQNPRSILV